MPITTGSSLRRNFPSPGSPRDLSCYRLGSGWFLEREGWTFLRTRRASRNGSLAVTLVGSGDVTSTHVLWRFEIAARRTGAPRLQGRGFPLPKRRNRDHSERSDRQGTQAGAFDGRARRLLRLTHRRRRQGLHRERAWQGRRLRAAGDWEILAINEFDSDIYATPAISEGQMYIRTQNALYAIGSSN